MVRDRGVRERLSQENVSKDALTKETVCDRGIMDNQEDLRVMNRDEGNYELSHIDNDVFPSGPHHRGSHPVTVSV